jgi:hypothetical protein
VTKAIYLSMLTWLDSNKTVSSRALECRLQYKCGAVGVMGVRRVECNTERMLAQEHIVHHKSHTT